MSSRLLPSQRFVSQNLFMHSKLPHPRLHPETPFAVRAMLSMATKYQISYIRDCIVERLESDWPQTILSWDTLEGEIERTTEHSNVHWYTDDRFPEPASAIRLARDFNIPSILPAAFYQLSRLNIADDHARQRKEVNSLYSELQHCENGAMGSSEWRRSPLCHERAGEASKGCTAICSSSSVWKDRLLPTLRHQQGAKRAQQRTWRCHHDGCSRAFSPNHNTL